MKILLTPNNRTDARKFMNVYDIVKLLVNNHGLESKIIELGWVVTCNIDLIKKILDDFNTNYIIYDHDDEADKMVIIMN